ncbi:MAG: hypothetical protein JW940_26795, partial [Polyangiaceae bacterium]|nr:hypothetical protein [Polyangiaceae bacterium]
SRAAPRWGNRRELAPFPRDRGCFAQWRHGAAARATTAPSPSGAAAASPSGIMAPPAARRRGAAAQWRHGADVQYLNGAAAQWRHGADVTAPPPARPRLCRPSS